MSYMVTITDKAYSKFLEIRPKSPAALRVAVVGGGCSGMNYKLDWVNTNTVTDNDEMYQYNALVVVIDKKSQLFLKDTSIDFSDGLNGTGFTFINPNAKRTCGCGNSFST